MIAIHPAAEQIKGEPEPVVIEFSLIGDFRGAVGSPDIFGLHQLSVGNNRANRLRRGARGFELKPQSADETESIFVMRLPMPIQATESSGGQWLIHRRETAQTRRSSRNIRRVLRQSIHKGGFEQVGMF